MNKFAPGNGATDPHEAHRTPREYPISIHHLPFPPRARAPTARRARTTSRSRTLDVIIKSLDDVPGDCFFQICTFVAVNLVFELGLVLVSEGVRLEDIGDVMYQLLVQCAFLLQGVTQVAL